MEQNKHCFPREWKGEEAELGSFNLPMAGEGGQGGGLCA